MPLTSRKLPTKIKRVFHKVSLDEIMKVYADNFTLDIWSMNYFCDVAKGQVIFELLVEETDGEGDSVDEAGI